MKNQWSDEFRIGKYKARYFRWNDGLVELCVYPKSGPGCLVYGEFFERGNNLQGTIDQVDAVIQKNYGFNKTQKELWKMFDKINKIRRGA